jgi:glycosyltransferase involved in cell wall biosynthesis
MSKRIQVALLRDLPEENWSSIAIYSDQLIRNLRAQAPEIDFVEVQVPLWKFPAARIPMPYGRAASLRTLGLYLTRWVRYPLALRRVRADVYHILDNSYGHLAFFLDRRRTVITYHGGGSGLPEQLVRWNPRGPALWLYRCAFRGMLRCAGIIAVSAFAQDELVTRARYPAERIRIARHGIAPNFRAPTNAERSAWRARWLSPDNRTLLLYVGNNDARKNVDALYRALHRLRQNDCSAQLLVVGATPTSAQARLIEEFGVAPFVAHLPRVANAELHFYYGAADAFVFPSLYEGFGIPLIEAMACGAPVVCSDSDLFREICGDAARYADARDPETFATEIARVGAEPQLARELRTRGLARARAFTWENCARQTLETYRWVADQNSSR